MSARRRCAKNHIELEHSAVHFDNKGKGIGTPLVQSRVRQAKNSRVGFKEVEHVIQDTSQCGFERGYEAYFLVYDVPKVVSEGQS
jgi:predicted GNAT family acetyltransferase